MKRRKIYNFFKDYKNTFVLISILLSFISIHAGFHYYNAQFGLTVALTTSFAFEVLRLTSLFGIFRSSGNTRKTSIALYIFSALVCASASLVSFHSWIITSENLTSNQKLEYYKNEIESIRAAQAKAMKSELTKNKNAMKICKSNIAKGYKVSYFTNRLKQRRENESEIATHYDSLMSYLPTNATYAWIQKEYSQYEMKLNKKRRPESEYDSINESIKTIYHVDNAKAKKVTMVIIVIGIELGIFLLALLSENYERINPDRKAILPAIRRFGEKSVEDFIHTCRVYYTKNSRFPRARELSKRNREIRKYITGKGKQEEAIIRMVFAFDK